MQIVAGRWVRVFQFRRDSMTCFNEVWKLLYSCHGSQVLPSVVRQELWSARVLLPLFRADLRLSWPATPGCQVQHSPGQSA